MDIQIILGKVRPLSRHLTEAHPQVLIIALDLFPYTELRTAPIAQPSAGLKSVPGRLDAQLLEDVKDRARELGFSDNELNAAAFSSWLEATSAQPPS